METVVLDKEQKAAVLADINEYLHSATNTWYAQRGIPYRRGYLFHGEPGTGKTSLSFAIAGVFGLKIYCISFLEPTLTEKDLGMLFNSLPCRCVVLLEDIDSAGLNRREDENAGLDLKAHGDRAGSTSGGEEFAKEIARAIKSVNDRNDRDNPAKK
jgi:mitochondrial chaperone BCS1